MARQSAAERQRLYRQRRDADPERRAAYLDDHWNKEHNYPKEDKDLFGSCIQLKLTGTPVSVKLTKTSNTWQNVFTIKACYKLKIWMRWQML
ncbi:hypothetical protein SRHO_G00282750 [Serrasalmus rhombeus]